jgi:MFS family permease
VEDFYRSLARNHRWNALMHIINGSLFSIGFAFMQSGVIVVAYLKHFTDNTIILNLPFLILNLSLAFGPFWGSFISRRFQRKKPPLLLFGFIQRLFLIPLILVVTYLSGNERALLPAFLGAYAVYHLFWGISHLFWQEVLSRTVPADRRGSVLGLRESISKIFGLLASFLSYYVLSRHVFPDNYSTLFIVAAISLAVSFLFYIGLREAPYEGPSVVEEFASHLKNILSLPRRDKSFRWFIIYSIFSSGTLFIGGLYTAVGIDRFSAAVPADRLAGIFAIVTGVSGVLFAPVMGRIYDRYGKFWGFFPVVVLSALLPLYAIVAGSLTAYLIIFFLRGIVWNAWYLEVTTLLSSASPEKHNEYIALFSLMKLLPIILYTNTGGLVANTVGSWATFATSSAFCLAALTILVLKLRLIWVSPRRS